LTRLPALLLPALLALPCAGQGAAWLQANYRKQEARIPMRDGQRLFTAIYTPRRPGSYPFLLNRTCYGIEPYGEAAFPERLGPAGGRLALEGAIIVYQDVRGRMMSEGVFQEMTPHREGAGVDEASDAFDTIQWLLEHVSGHNGRVGAWGTSYPGFYAASSLVGAHPALKAVSPQAPIADLFAGDDDHHNGALFLAQAFWFAAAFGKARPAPTRTWSWDPGFAQDHPDGYRFFLELGALGNADRRWFKGGIASWLDTCEHGSYDAFWQARNLLPHLRGIRPAVLTVGGWFDAEDLYGALHVHQRIRESSPGAVSTLVMGPWSHGAWTDDDASSLGQVAFGQNTAEYFQEQVEAPFFRHHLKAGPDPQLPGALVFETGGNRWRRFPAWPPASTATPLYFREAGLLSPQPPATVEGFDAFSSDPARPVPYTAGTEPRVSAAFMVEDQRFAARRPDVLVYQTPVLETGLTLAGPVQVRLQVSTSGSDADWVVKLIDVYPDGFGASDPDPAQWEPPANPLGGMQQLVRGDILRGKFRDSLAEPRPFVPDQPTAVNFSLNDVCHTFAKGHRLMVQVQSSWFPLVDRNPQVFTDIYHARDEDFRKAEQRLYRSAGLPSQLILPVLAP
jgi:putative CocE/NonD family hydrolase